MYDQVSQMFLSDEVESISMAPYEIPSHVLYKTLDGEAVLVNLQSGEYFSLNPLGTQVWKALEEGKGPGEIGDKLVEKYEVSRDELDRDLADLVETLVAEGLLISRPE